MNIIWILVCLRAATALLGGTFVFYSWQAYRRHPSAALASFGIASSLLVLGVLAEGVAVLLFGAGLGTAEAVEAGMVLVAFTFLLVSVRMHRGA